MKIRVTGYSHTYPLGASGQFEKAWIEADMDESDDIQTSLQFLKQQVEQFHKESNPNGLTVTTVKKIPNVLEYEKSMEEKKKSPEERVIRDIGTCTSLTVLKACYEKLALRNEKIKSAYDNRLKQLTA